MLIHTFIRHAVLYEYYYSEYNIVLRTHYLVHNMVYCTKAYVLLFNLISAQ